MSFFQVMAEYYPTKESSSISYHDSKSKKIRESFTMEAKSSKQAGKDLFKYLTEEREAVKIKITTIKKLKLLHDGNSKIYSAEN